MIKIRAMMARIFSYSGRHAKISLKITDKEPIFADLSVSKTHFTDKTAFSNDLSVNFWQLWWGFTDKSHLGEHLSVKPCPKRLNFYGQSVNFHRCVRKRQSFCQMQRLISQRPSSQSKLPPNYFWLFPSWKAIIRFFDLRQSFFPASFRLDINKTSIMKLFVK